MSKQKLALIDGSYPTLGAGYLSRTNAIVTNGVGWYKLATLNVSALSTIANDRTYSVIVDIQGVNPAGEIANNAASSRIEIDAVASTSGFVAQNTAIKVLSGYVDPSTLCAVTNTNEIVIYVYYGSLNRTFFTIVSEVWVTTPIEALQFAIDNTPITTAPANAVYAVVRNNASADDNGYSFDTNYVWHNNGQVEVNTLKDGTTSLDFNDYLEEGKYELQGKADNTVVNFPTSSLNTSGMNCDWYLVVYRRSHTYVTQVAYSVRADNAISIRSRDNGEWREWRLLFEDGVAQSIPTASETVIGGAKMYKDSEGYFCIDTE